MFYVKVQLQQSNLGVQKFMSGYFIVVVDKRFESADTKYAAHLREIRPLLSYLIHPIPCLK
jgi:hypothetical protein